MNSDKRKKKGWLNQLVWCVGGVSTYMNTQPEVMNHVWMDRCGERGGRL